MVSGLISGCFSIILFAFRCWICFFFYSIPIFLLFSIFPSLKKINNTRDWFIRRSINRGGVKKKSMRINKRTRFGAKDGVFCVCVFSCSFRGDLECAFNLLTSTVLFFYNTRFLLLFVAGFLSNLGECTEARGLGGFLHLNPTWVTFH